MARAGQDGGQDSAARAARALERGATTLGAQVARSVYERWRRLPAARREKLAGLAANVRERALDSRGEAARHTPGQQPRQPGERLADPMARPAAADPGVSDVEVRDLRAELARELDRLAGADIQASRGGGSLAGEAPAPDGQA